MTAAIFRATNRILLPRVLVVLISAAAIIALQGASTALTLGIAMSGLIVMLFIEQRSIHPVRNSHS